MLCSHTNWFESNVGHKFFILINKVLLFNPDQYKVDKKEVVNYECLTYILNRILTYLWLKIKSENKVEDLSDDDKKLIMIIIKTYHNLSYSSCYIDW